MVLQRVTVEEQCPIVADLLESPIFKYITLAKNNCECSGTEEELIVNYIHPLFLKSEAALSK